VNIKAIRTFTIFVALLTMSLLEKFRKGEETENFSKLSKGSLDASRERVESKTWFGYSDKRESILVGN